MTNSLFNHNKKGSIVDAIPVMIYFFVFAIICAVCFVMYQGMITNGFFTIMSAGSVTTFAPSGANLTDIQQQGENAYDVLDGLAIFVFIGTALASMLGALLLRTHPAFFFISIVVLLMQVIIAMAFANSWIALITTPAMSAAQTQFPITNFFLANFPTAIFSITLLISVILYGINPLGQ